MIYDLLVDLLMLIDSLNG